MKFLGRVFHLFCLSVGFFWTGVSAILVVLSSFVSESLMMDAHRLWAKGCLWIIGIHVRFEGLENLPRDHSVILAPNHASLFDILVLGAMPFNFKWLSKDEARKIPFVGWGMKRLGAFFVKRDRSGHDLNVLKGVEDGLRAGYSVVIFPEGTRTRTGQLLPLKKGAFKAAQNSGAPLLPVAISGTFEIAKPGELPHRRGFEVLVRFGREIRVAPGDDIATAMRDFKDTMETLLHASSGQRVSVV